MPTVIPFEDLRVSPTATLFQGRDTTPVSIFVTGYERGLAGPATAGQRPAGAAGRALSASA
jgi:hypothetical protein